MVLLKQTWLPLSPECSAKQQVRQVTGSSHTRAPYLQKVEISQGSARRRPSCRGRQRRGAATALGYPMAVGLNKGHKVRKNVSQPRHSRRRRRLTKHTKFVRDMIQEVCGFAPYERRATELLKVSKDKRALRFIKKREELSNVLASMRKAVARKD
ncbi:hypothetical protein ACRRTK_022116 [Alexandromys fortis]